MIHARSIPTRQNGIIIEMQQCPACEAWFPAFWERCGCENTVPEVLELPTQEKA